MIDQLEAIDRAIVLAINGWHTPFLDEFFWYTSARWVWIPAYIYLLWLSWKSFGKQAVWFVLIVVATIVIADIGSVHLFKEAVQRYRPSHNTLLTNQLHYYLQKDGTNYMGGLYGFVSSHATNFFTLTVLIGLTLRSFYPKLVYWMLGCSVLVCLSRIYLGVHYFSDVFVGALWGSSVAYLVYRLVIKRYGNRIFGLYL